MSRPLVQVPERGAAMIPLSHWRLLEPDPAFWTVVEAGLVSVSQPTRDRVELTGAGSVGRATLDEVDLEIAEKVPGALGALVAAEEDDVRVMEGEAPSSSPGAFGRSLISAFLSEARAYASTGLDFRYATNARIGTLIAGRLDTRRTMSLRAAGRSHLVGFHRSSITQDTEINRAVLAGLREVERVTHVLDLPASDVAAARSLAAYFSDARGPEVLFAQRSELAKAARNAAASVETNRLIPLLRLAAALLESEAFHLGADRSRVVPRAWFINLAPLFERAVRAAFSEVAASMGYTVRSGRHFERTLFREPTNVFRVDPDIVLVRDAAVEGVLDVKYKARGTEDSVGGSHSDVYQLVAHAAAFDAPVACLVFPGDEFSFKALRDAATGADVLLVTADPRDLHRDVSRALDAMRLHGDKARARADERRRTDDAAQGERDVAERQKAAERTLARRVSKVAASQLEVIDAVIRGLMPEAWDAIGPEPQAMLRTAVYFGLHASDEGIDYSGPVLGVFSVCERVLRDHLFQPMAQRDRSFRRVTFGEAAALIAQENGGDRRGRAVRRWLADSSQIDAGNLRECAREMQRMNATRIAAAHSEFVAPEQWTKVFERVLPAPDGLLPQLVKSFQGGAE